MPQTAEHNMRKERRGRAKKTSKTCSAASTDMCLLHVKNFDINAIYLVQVLTWSMPSKKQNNNCTDSLGCHYCEDFLKSTWLCNVHLNTHIEHCLKLFQVLVAKLLFICRR